MNAAQAEANLRARGDDVARCDYKRALAVDSWPKTAPKVAGE